MRGLIRHRGVLLDAFNHLGRELASSQRARGYGVIHAAVAAQVDRHRNDDLTAYGQVGLANGGSNSHVGKGAVVSRVLNGKGNGGRARMQQPIPTR